MKLGSVVSIQIAQNANDPLTNLQEVNAVAGMGLEGDRYYTRSGTYSKKHDESREATFIEEEALQALGKDYHVEFSGTESRRNFTTRGVALNHLVGKEFRVGQAVFRGIRLCEPCGHLEEVSGKEARKGLIHRGGLRDRSSHPAWSASATMWKMREDNNTTCTEIRALDPDLCVGAGRLRAQAAPAGLRPGGCLLCRARHGLRTGERGHPARGVAGITGCEGRRVGRPHRLH